MPRDPVQYRGAHAITPVACSTYSDWRCGAIVCPWFGIFFACIHWERSKFLDENIEPYLYGSILEAVS